MLWRAGVCRGHELQIEVTNALHLVFDGLVLLALLAR